MLKKSNNKWLFGVAGGVAEYFKINADLLRIALILSVVLLDLGVLIIAYIIMAIIMPGADNEQDTVIVVDEQEQEDDSKVDSTDKHYIFGIILVIIGVLALLKEQLKWSWRIITRYNIQPVREYFLPIILIIIGGIILYRSLNKR